MMSSWYTPLLLKIKIYLVKSKGDFTVPIVTSTYFQVFILKSSGSKRQLKYLTKN